MENPFELILERLDRIEKAIEKLHIPVNKDTDEYMNVEQVANFIDSTKSTIYGLTHDRKIPFYKNGKKLFFKKSEIIAWIESKRVNTNQEIHQMANEYLLRNPLFK